MSRVLIVEDEPSIAEMLQLVCDLAGADARVAANGRAALDTLMGFMPDLILTDFMMPVMDGCEFVNIMRKDPAFSHVPVIVMTSAPEAAARRCEGETIVAKPIDIDDLLRRLREIAAEAT